MTCTNEEPCRNCDICDREPGDDICDHGDHYLHCEICNPPTVAKACKHGVVGDCDACEDIAEARLQAECDMGDNYCKHDIPEDECMECGAELDAAADRAREHTEWLHFHPND